MKGVEILTSYEVVIERAFNWNMFWILFWIILIILTMIIFGSYKCYSFKDFLSNCFMILFFGVVLGCFSGWANSIPTEYETRYKVTLPDGISINKFVEKYEILEQEGKIFTIRELE